MTAGKITDPCTELPVVLVDDLPEDELLEVDVGLVNGDNFHVTITARDVTSPGQW